MATEKIIILVQAKGVRDVNIKLSGIGRAAKKSGKSVNFLKRALLGVGAVEVIRRTLRVANVYKNLQNRLKLVTSGSQELAKVTEDLFAVANRSRSSFETTAEVYARTALSLKELGITAKETLEFTETLNKAIILSGASAQEARNGIIQLSQGMASNRLSGDELRAVLEQLPLVADVISKSLGITRGELREFGSQGKISAAVVLKAFREARVEIADKFTKATLTAGQGFEIFLNNLIKTVGELDEATGATSALAEVLVFVGTHSKALIKTLLVLTPTILATSGAFTLMATSIKSATIRLITLIKTANVNPFVRLATVIATVALAFTLWKDQIKISSDGQVTLGDVVRSTLKDIKQLGTELLHQVNDVIPAFSEAWKKSFADIDFSFEGIIRAAARTTDRMIAVFTGSFFAIVAVFDALPEAFENVFTKAFNKVSSTAVVFVNTLTDLFSKSGVGKLLNLDLGKALTFPKLPEVENSFEDLGDKALTAFLLGFSATSGFSPIEGAVDTALARFRREASERLRRDKIIGEGGAQAPLSDFSKGIKSGLERIETNFLDFSKNIENAIVGAFRGAEDALVDFVKTGSFNFKKFANDIIEDIGRILFRAAISPLVSGLIGSFGVAKDTGFKTVPGLAGGGLVRGAGTGTSDSIPTRLSNREFVINAAATKRFRPVLEAINSGTSVAQSTPSSSRSVGGGGSMVFAPQINVTVEGGDSDSNAEQGVNIANAIKVAMAKQMADFSRMQQRNGGIFNPQVSF